MIKEYVLKNIPDMHKYKIEKIVRESDPIVSSPSNILDIYDMEKYRVSSLNGDVDLKAILDNNIFTHIVGLINGSKSPNTRLSDEAKIACAIMCFLIYSGIEANPLFAISEVPDDPKFKSKKTQDYYFRIADHVHPKIFAGLALGRLTHIPKKYLISSKYHVDTNKETQDNIRNTSFEKENSEVFKVLFINILKAWILYKTEKNQLKRLELILKWNLENSLSEDTSMIFMIIFLSDRRMGKMIKNVNSSNPDNIIKQVSNACWDLSYLFALKSLHDKSGSREVWFFITRDKVLKEISRFIYALKDRCSAIEFIEKYYENEGVLLFLEYMEKVNKRENREEHKDKIRLKIDSSIVELKNQVFEVLG